MECREKICSRFHGHWVCCAVVRKQHYGPGPEWKEQPSLRTPSKALPADLFDWLVHQDQAANLIMNINERCNKSSTDLPRCHDDHSGMARLQAMHTLYTQMRQSEDFRRKLQLSISKIAQSRLSLRTKTIDNADLRGLWHDPKKIKRNWKSLTNTWPTTAIWSHRRRRYEVTDDGDMKSPTTVNESLTTVIMRHRNRKIHDKQVTDDGHEWSTDDGHIKSTDDGHPATDVGQRK